MNKAQIRSSMRAQRTHLTIAEVQEKSARIQSLFCERFSDVECLCAYSAIQNEVCTDRILQSYPSVFLPVTDKDGTMRFYLYDGRMQSGMFGVLEPTSGILLSEKPDVVIVPGVAFSKNGGRLGYGKGCYDRYFASDTCIKVGFSYAFQVLEHLETEPHDILMDYLITEEKIIDCKVIE